MKLAEDQEDTINIPSRVNVAEAARLAMDGAASFREGAQNLLAKAPRGSDLYIAIMEPHELHACMSACQLAMKDFRRETWTSPNRSIPTTSVYALLASTRAMLMDFPLPGGKALRDAIKPDVEAASSFYSKQSTDMGYKSRWLSLVAGKVKKGKTVGQSLDNDALEILQTEAQK